MKNGLVKSRLLTALSPEYGDASPLQVRSGRLSPEYGDASPLQVQSGRLSGAPISDKNCHIMVQM